MRQSRLYFLLLFFGVLFSVGFFWGCGKKEIPASIKISIIPSSFASVGDKRTISIAATGPNNSVIENGTILKIAVSLGSFSATKMLQNKNIPISNGKALVEWWVGTKEGIAKITVTSPYTSKETTVQITEKAEILSETIITDASSPEENIIMESLTDDVPEFIIQQELTMTMTVSKKILMANGSDVAEIILKIQKPTIPIAELKRLKFEFTTNTGTFLDFQTRAPLKPKANKPNTYEVGYHSGAFHVYIQASGTAKTAQISASIDTAKYRGNIRTTLDMVDLGFIEFYKANPGVIGTKGSGKEVSTVSFKLLDTKRKPFPKGTKVTFRMSSAGGANLSPSEAFSDANGIISTQVKSGSTNVTVTVIAKVAFEAPKNLGCPKTCKVDSDCMSCGNFRCDKDTFKCSKILEATSSAIAIVGGRPNHKSMTFTCEKENIGAFYGLQGSTIKANIATKCTIKLGDRFSNKVGFSTQVLFMVEAGLIDATAQTVPYTPSAPTGTVGIASVLMRTQLPLPVDVLPMSVPNVKNCGNATCTIPDPNVFTAKEPLAWMPYDCTDLNGNRLFVEPYYVDSFNNLRNPRDGYVTVLAYTSGEEEFSDSNGDGVYTPGETFTDLGEPYLDANDNGRWDATLPNKSSGEPFIDTPCTKEQVQKKINGCKTVGIGNGKRDGPNGKWDSNIQIWRTTRIIWSGPAVFLPVTTPINPTVKLATHNKCTTLDFHSGIHPKTSFIIEPNKSKTYDVTIHDANLNPLTSISTVQYKANDVNLIKNPPSSGAGDRRGFELKDIKIPSSFGAFQLRSYILPASFFGIGSKQYNHRITLEDSDGTKGKTSVHVRFDTTIFSTAGAGTGVKTETLFFSITGVTY